MNRTWWDVITTATSVVLYGRGTWPGRWTVKSILRCVLLSMLMLMVAGVTGAQCGWTPLGSIASVPANPFQAEVQVAEAPTENILILDDRVDPAEEQTEAIVARDSQGRVRVETYSGPFSKIDDKAQKTEARHRVITITICNPGAQEMITLDPRDKTARLVKGPTPVSHHIPPSKAVAPNFCDGQLQLEAHSQSQMGTQNVSQKDLAHRSIEGVEARGRELWVPGLETQLWCSEELGSMILRKEIATPQIHTIAQHKMTNIRREEPDPSLFMVPPDYKIVSRW
jgi:hypothetical protein